MCVCSRPGHGSLPLEGSDQREGSRDISPMYTPERERSATKISRIKCACVCARDPADVHAPVSAGRPSTGLCPRCRTSQRCWMSFWTQLQQSLLGNH